MIATKKISGGAMKCIKIKKKKKKRNDKRIKTTDDKNLLPPFATLIPKDIRK